MIDRVYTIITNGKESMINVIYTSGLVRRYYPYSSSKNIIPNTVKQYMKQSYIYFPEKNIKLYKLAHD